jgi:aminoglycoside 6-adenylyltransferase
MRSDQEMFDLILNTAIADDRVRAVMLNGSRANPNTRRDPFQDFDIVYFVTAVDSFKADPEWIRCFGDLMILQLPDDMPEPPPDPGGSYAYLMQFSDGNRIDLGLFPIAKLDELEADSLSVLLLDKDGIFGSLPPADESGYLPRPPTAKQFADCCNEFWWVCPYVAKGLWRAEFLYARYMLDVVVREELMKMLRWYIGMGTDFSINPGKFGKHFQQYLEPQIWELLLRTYADGDYERTWEALYEMAALFQMTALQVAQKFGLVYPHEDANRVSAHLSHVRRLSKKATEIY